MDVPIEIPEVAYVSVGGADVAYQVVGNGPVDLLYFWGLGSHLILQWENPEMAAHLRGLASMARLILFDRRGTGVSDALSEGGVATWEEWTEDIAAVLDTTGSTEAVIYAGLEAGPIAIQFAALHPRRVRALVLGNTSARFLRADDYPIGFPEKAIDTFVDLVATAWGTPQFVGVISQGAAEDSKIARLWMNQLRSSATPRAAAAQYRYLLKNIDARSALPCIQAPTLVLHSRVNPLFPLEHGHYLADHIAGAKLLELPGSLLDINPERSPPWVEITEFLTGDRPATQIDRVLTTVLFTDIVGSTGRALLHGDAAWKTLVDTHDRIVREHLRRFRGSEIKTLGDGFVASFDGPARAIRCAQEVSHATAELGVQLRVGLHTGECEVRGDDLGGLAVHIAARVAALAVPGEILVSGTVKDLVVGSGIQFSARGEHEVKGVPGYWKLFAVRS